MIVFAADLHLTPLIWQDYPELREDSYNALMQILSYCLENRPTALILGGDVWNRSRPDPDSVVRFVRSVDTLVEAGIDVYAIQGQHERATPPWTNVHKSIKYVGDGRVSRIVDGDIGTFTMRGFDCQPANSIREAVKVAKDECDIMLVHQLARQMINIEGAWDFDETWVPANVKLILAGDYHEPVKSGRLYYSGSTHMRSIDERTQRSFITVGKKFKVTRHKLEQRGVIEVLVNDENQLAAAEKTIAAFKYGGRHEDIGRPVVYARINADVPNVIERLKVACEDKHGGKFLKPKIIGGGVEVVEQIQLPEGEVTLESCLSQAVDRDTDPKLHSFVLALLKSKEPRAVCEATRAELGL
jgi:hypothetical protein